MDLELNDEQVWLSESIDTLLGREWLPVEAVASATAEQRRSVWERLVEFGALTIGGDEGLGAVELCLIARSLGARLASVPFVGSAAVRLALAPFAETLASEVAGVLAGEAAIAIALLEPASSWSVEEPATTARRAGGSLEVYGEKVAIEHLEVSARLAVIVGLDGQPTLVLLPPDVPGIVREARPSFDESVPMASVRFDGVPATPDALVLQPAGRDAVNRLISVGGLLAAAESIGAASAVLELASRYASERRQFGHTIASFQSLRHLLADMYVRQASGWSTVLYAAAAFDDGAADAARTASIAKAYVSRGARQVAHDAMQVFGGIAFTAEHPAHRFLRRIVLREQQFGDAAHHERELGRALASQLALAPAPAPAPAPRILAEASLS